MLRFVGAFIFCQAEPDLFGGIAQLGEHLPCKQGVSGSIPLTSTSSFLLRNVDVTERPIERNFLGT